MDSKIRPDFSHFVALTLQSRMPWKMLSSILINLAPTLNETREIISILLKELEALQSIFKLKEKELEKYQGIAFTAKIQKSNIEHQKNTLGAEITTNELQGNKQ